MRLCAALLLPVELRHESHTASTNPVILAPGPAPGRRSKPYNATSTANFATPMSNPSPVEQIAERVDRLLLRYAELQRTNELLNRQVAALTQERDSLKSRLGAARARVDALLERLPEASAPQKETP